MAVDVQPSVLVHRSPAEVAAFMFDPANDLRWTGGQRQVRRYSAVVCQYHGQGVSQRCDALPVVWGERASVCVDKSVASRKRQTQTGVVGRTPVLQVCSSPTSVKHRHGT